LERGSTGTTSILDEEISPPKSTRGILVGKFWSRT